MTPSAFLIYRKRAAFNSGVSALGNGNRYRFAPPSRRRDLWSRGTSQRLPEAWDELSAKGATGFRQDAKFLASDVERDVAESALARE
jgi:hypothetical protein